MIVLVRVELFKTNEAVEILSTLIFPFNVWFVASKPRDESPVVVIFVLLTLIIAFSPVEKIALAPVAFVSIVVSLIVVKEQLLLKIQL